MELGRLRFELGMGLGCSQGRVRIRVKRFRLRDRANLNSTSHILEHRVGITARIIVCLLLLLDSMCGGYYNEHETEYLRAILLKPNPNPDPILKCSY